MCGACHRQYGFDAIILMPTKLYGETITAYHFLMDNYSGEEI